MLAASASAQDWPYHEASAHTGRTANGLYPMPRREFGSAWLNCRLRLVALCLPKTGACRTVGRRRLFSPLSDFRGEPALPHNKHTTPETGCQACQDTQERARIHYSFNERFLHLFRRTSGIGTSQKNFLRGIISAKTRAGEERAEAVCPLQKNDLLSKRVFYSM